MKSVKQIDKDLEELKINRPWYSKFLIYDI